MSNTTLEDYKNAIWLAYDIIKKNDATGIFSDPTPAQIRDYYVRLFEKGLKKSDVEIMKAFFETNENESLKRSIENSNIEKFKPIISFLIGKTKNPDNRLKIELAAILVSFEKRPYRDYIKSDTHDSPTIIIEDLNPAKTEDINLDKYKQENEYSGSLLSKQNNVISQNLKTKLSKPKHNLLAGFICFGLIIIVLMYNYYSNLHKDCLQWNKDRYVEVDCNMSSIGFTNLGSQVSYNENLLQIRKIDPTDTTTYFKNGKAVLWYSKDNNGGIELFNAPGHHPVSGKPLHSITNYMINKYLKK